MISDIQLEVVRLMKKAYRDAELCHSCIVGSDRTMHGRSAALSYAETGLAYCLAAKAIYYARNEKFNGIEISDLFHLFETFVREVQTNYATDHSHQWSDIEFERLKDAYNDSICSEPITQ